MACSRSAGSASPSGTKLSDISHHPWLVKNNAHATAAANFRNLSSCTVTKVNLQVALRGNKMRSGVRYAECGRHRSSVPSEDRTNSHGSIVASQRIQQTNALIVPNLAPNILINQTPARF
jgi:hypothetical protein